MKTILKENKWKLLFTSLVTLLPSLMGLILWNTLPDKIPTHFGADGTADGWSSKAFAVFALPAFLLVIHWVCVLATSFDPKKQNIHRKVLGIVLWICPVISLIMENLCYAHALGWEINMATVMFLFCGVLFIIIGNYLPKCRQSYTVGIKIPWTLADEGNWNATHRLGGKLWVGGGLILLAISPLAHFPAVSISVFWGDILLMVLIPTVYSYVYYKKHSGEKE
ncbi:MAG: SdpI family protein [Clostridia bacterium]|nr:SdpI family protein [Clostridia bacterium]